MQKDLEINTFLKLFDEYLEQFCNTEPSSQVINTTDLRERIFNHILTLNKLGIGTHPSSESALLQAFQRKMLLAPHLTAICLLRLLTYRQMSRLTESNWRPLIVDLFDAEFKESIYKEKKIEIKMMGHEKVELLTRIVQEAQKKYDECLSMLSLEQSGAQRQKLMSTINDKTGREVFRTFLPGKIEGIISRMHELTQEYLEHKNDIDIIDIFSSNA